jgi:flagellar export protein FliJ
MAFRYPLQPVLRLRQSLEHQEEQRLFAATALVVRLRAEIEQLEYNHQSRRRAELDEMKAGAFGASFEFLVTCDAAYRKARSVLLAQLDQAERRRKEQLRIYQTARQKREIFEGLRDRQETAYDLAESRHEQQRIDEAFLIRSFLDPGE